jgi:phage-related protein
VADPKPVEFRGSSQAVYVLHCFQKKTQTMSKGDIELANKRYRELRKELGI